jgi:hypothetical protein
VSGDVTFATFFSALRVGTLREIAETAQLALGTPACASIDRGIGAPH